MGKIRRAAALLAVLALAGAAPFFLTQLELFTASRVAILALWATSLNLLLGRAGIVSFAHAAYFGVGAYTVALLWLHLGWSPLVGVALSLPVGAAVALVTGAVAFRAARLYFALLTLALSQLMFAIAFQWYSVTLGDNGIHSIQVPELLAPLVNSYWFVVAVVAVGLAALWTIWRSPFGATLLAIRENRLRASFIGIDVRRYELAAFVVAGAFASLAGSLFALFNREAYPNLLFWTENAQPIFVTLIGGMHSFFGPLVGSGLFVMLEEAVTRRTLYSGLVIGMVLLAIVLVLPEGVTGSARRLAGARRRAVAPPAGPASEPEREGAAL